MVFYKIKKVIEQSVTNNVCMRKQVTVPLFRHKYRVSHYAEPGFSCISLMITRVLCTCFQQI